MQKSVITPDFERKECVPPYRESLHQQKKQRRVSEELPQIMKQAVVESCMLGLFAYPGLMGNWVRNCHLVSSLSCPVKSHPFKSPAQWSEWLYAQYKSVIDAVLFYNSGRRICVLRVHIYIIKALSVFCREEFSFLSCPSYCIQIHCSWYCILGRARENNRWWLVWYESPRNHKWTEKWS